MQQLSAETILAFMVTERCRSSTVFFLPPTLPISSPSPLMDDTGAKPDDRTALWAQVVAVASIKTLVPIMFDVRSSNYTK